MVGLLSSKSRLVALAWSRMGIKVHKIGEKEASLNERAAALDGGR